MGGGWNIWGLLRWVIVSRLDEIKSILSDHETRIRALEITLLG